MAQTDTQAEQDTADHREKPQDTGERERQSTADPVGSAIGLVQASLRLAGDTVDLLAVELELAARSLALLIALSLLLATLGVFIWILLLAALGAYLKTGPELGWFSMFLVLALVNGLLGFLLWLFMTRLARRLGLPGFRASIRSVDPVSATPEPEK